MVDGSEQNEEEEEEEDGDDSILIQESVTRAQGDAGESVGEDEDPETRRRKRLELNRKAAQESRARKKARIEELQRNVVFLSRENAELREQNYLMRQMLGAVDDDDNDDEHEVGGNTATEKNDEENDMTNDIVHIKNHENEVPSSIVYQEEEKFPASSNFANLLSAQPDLLQAMAEARFPLTPELFAAAAAAAATIASGDSANEMQQHTAASLMTIAAQFLSSTDREENDVDNIGGGERTQEEGE
uniref:BZIP domain-containing protein n=1 Tax=Aureoumbra lagunensis TaxID=44058 RepID=A0A7S3K2F0_9STRA